MKGCRGREGIHACACNTYVSSSYIMNRRGRKKKKRNKKKGKGGEQKYISRLQKVLLIYIFSIDIEGVLISL